MHAIYHVKWQGDFNKSLAPFLIFDCWQLSSFFSLFPFGPMSMKAVRKPGHSVPWCWWGSSNQEHPNPRARSSPQPHPLFTIKTWATHPFFIQAKWMGLNACPTLPRKPHDVNYKLCHTLLVHVWHHQPQDRNQFWVGGGGLVLSVCAGTSRQSVLTTGWSKRWPWAPGGLSSIALGFANWLHVLLASARCELLPASELALELSLHSVSPSKPWLEIWPTQVRSVACRGESVGLWPFFMQPWVRRFCLRLNYVFQCPHKLWRMLDSGEWLLLCDHWLCFK